MPKECKSYHNVTISVHISPHRRTRLRECIFKEASDTFPDIIFCKVTSKRVDRGTPRPVVVFISDDSTKIKVIAYENNLYKSECKHVLERNQGSNLQKHSFSHSLE